MPELCTLVPDIFFPAFNSQECSMNIQASLMDPDLHVEKGRIELPEG
jgi:hypothetical protein